LYQIVTFLFLGAVAAAQTPATPAKPKGTTAKPAARPAASAPKTTRPAATPAPSTTAAPAAATAPAATGDQTVITIGTETISAREFEQFIQALPDQYKAAAQGPMKRQLAEQFAQVKVMAREARRRGLDKDPSVRSQIEFQSENLLAGALFRQMQNEGTPDEAMLRKSYDERKGEFERAQARHILIRFKGSPVPVREGKTELSEEEALAKANDIRKKLAAGEDFAKLAKDESDDVGSGVNGGDLGLFGRNQMVKEFEQSAFSLPIGQVSEPVKTQFGYHIIRVDKREAQTFDQARPQLEQRLRPEAARSAADKLKNDAAIKLSDTYFGPAQPPAAPPAGAAAGGHVHQPGEPPHAGETPAPAQSKPEPRPVTPSPAKP
jgi:peptidyl-prolyl cis-trans isomerase C